MKESKSQYVKRTQKDYTLSFKLEVVGQIERGELSLSEARLKYGIQGHNTIRVWLQKYGNFDWENQCPNNMTKSKTQTILELEQKIKLLEKQNATLEHRAEQSDRKAAIFDMMIDMAEQEYNISVRKKLLTRVVDHYSEKEEMSISSTCKLLGYDRQVYYRSKKSFRQKRLRASKVINLVQGVRQIMPRIGTRKLYFLLQEQLNRLGVGRDKLFSILAANHMLINPEKNYKTTTNSHHRFRKYKNLIELLDINRPEQVWVSDITYIGGRGNYYLSLITDAYSKKIMGYNLSTSLATAGSLKALNMANRNRIYKEKELIHHSDRGIQYCSNEYQKRLRQMKITPSMTESYDPYANAIAERVNGILKQEFLLEKYKVDLKTMKILVKQAIEIYNTQRPHYSCNMKTPQEMHLQQEIKIKKYKKQNPAVEESLQLD
ncbi:transposase [Bacteroides coprosuis DSM 18011]|uniref:Transposase n=1 Tax=Bacteroides coprosuis DSM 18011 TaxID=679937 RepID=F3ZRQ2_9BACE|nr:transposase [Bacteroides coprosuis DSM 18011]